MLTVLAYSYASKLVKNGVSLFEVSVLRGHSDSKMTLRYAHLASNDASKQASKQASKASKQASGVYHQRPTRVVVALNAPYDVLAKKRLCDSYEGIL